MQLVVVEHRHDLRRQGVEQVGAGQAGRAPGVDVAVQGLQQHGAVELLQSARGVGGELVEPGGVEAVHAGANVRRAARLPAPATYAGPVPTYAYRCRTCDTAFEVQRSVTASPVTTPCPSGHDATSRVWSPVAVGGSAPAPAGAGGGCCGGGCCG